MLARTKSNKKKEKHRIVIKDTKTFKDYHIKLPTEISDICTCIFLSLLDIQPFLLIQKLFLPRFMIMQEV